MTADPMVAGATVHMSNADSRLWTCEEWLSKDEADALMAHVGTLALEDHPSVVMRGISCKMRRSLGFFYRR